AEFFESFVEDIFPMSYAAAGVLGDSLKISVRKQPFRVLDLAAGSGVWGIALAQKSPLVRVTAVDWAGVIPVTKRIARRFGLIDRFRFVEGDILEVNFGRDHHLATLGHILHSEGEKRSRKLLARTFKSLAPGGTIAIAEFTPNDDRSGPPGAMIFGVNMLVNTQDGDVFTLKEVRSWLNEAGFKNVRTLQAPAPSPLILATKPK
ncbi:MAG TPA: methyltransferase, partial [Tepidisphaeraceae bacterium]